MIVEIECNESYSKDIAILNEDGSYFLKEEFLVYNFNTGNYCR